MIRNWKLAGVCGLLCFATGQLTGAQDLGQGPGAVAATGVPAGVVAPAGDFFDLSSILPYDLGIGDVNGVTDRTGMPIAAPLFKGDPFEATAAINENPTQANTRKSATKRTHPSTKTQVSRVRTAKTKDARKTGKSSGAVGATGPQYYVPHGSIEWTPANMTISTSPADPYGYGYGFSGYGTEVFGDFWKGWPMAR